MEEIVFTQEDFLKLLRGDRITSEISEILQQTAMERLNNKKRAGDLIPKKNKHLGRSGSNISLSYLNEADNSITEIPLTTIGPKEVNIALGNEDNLNIKFEFDKKDKLISSNMYYSDERDQVTLKEMQDKREKIIKNFEQRLTGNNIAKKSRSHTHKMSSKPTNKHSSIPSPAEVILFTFPILLIIN